MIWPYLVSLGIIIILLLFIFIINRGGLTKHIDRLKPVIEVLYIITSIFTIFSILYAIGTYYEDKSIKETSDKIILKNLKSEIDINIVIFDSFNENEYKFRNTGEFLFTRYENYYLIKARDLIDDEYIRNLSIISAKYIDDMNFMLNLFAEIYIPSTSNQYIGYHKLKNETITLLLNKQMEIIPNLIEISEYLNNKT